MPDEAGHIASQCGHALSDNRQPKPTTMFDATHNVKNRFETIRTDFTDKLRPDAAFENAQKAAHDTKQKAVEYATGIPARIIEKFEAAFREALAALTHYGKMTARRYIEGFGHYTDAFDAMLTGIENYDNPEIALDMAKKALTNVAAGGWDIYVAEGMMIPLKHSFTAGAKILSGSVSVATLAQLTVPVVFTIAIGYAALRVKDYAAEKVENMVEDLLENFDFDDIEDMAEEADSDEEDADDDDGGPKYEVYDVDTDDEQVENILNDLADATSSEEAGA